ncbi:hypothetical protein SAMN04489712_12943 [Thermomonospora echinospora]|uniref:Phage integrase family protein n=1 Tax=Thermomonospora echinospora TaxID=1992 RepID=A0A1H6E1R3_9ACTN|nr:hypothetical protein [Thermomonospora echinospora]SEG91512.1 hypothetical protein SAMN04489712_12943 [Thermomonospora echinospora]
MRGGSWLAWCQERGDDAPVVPAWVRQLPTPDSRTPARSRRAIDRLIARRDVVLPEKTLYRMLYETAGRAEEVLGVNIEDLDLDLDLDLAGRRCPVKAKGARAKSRWREQARALLEARTALGGPGTG